MLLAQLRQAGSGESATTSSASMGGEGDQGRSRTAAQNAFAASRSRSQSAGITSSSPTNSKPVSTTAQPGRRNKVRWNRGARRAVMQEAVASVLSGAMSAEKAAQRHGIPARTLRRYVANKRRQQQAEENGGEGAANKKGGSAATKPSVARSSSSSSSSSGGGKKSSKASSLPGNFQNKAGVNILELLAADRRYQQMRRQPSLVPNMAANAYRGPDADGEGGRKRKWSRSQSPDSDDSRGSGGAPARASSMGCFDDIRMRRSRSWGAGSLHFAAARMNLGSGANAAANAAAGATTNNASTSSNGAVAQAQAAVGTGVVCAAPAAATSANAERARARCRARSRAELMLDGVGEANAERNGEGGHAGVSGGHAIKQEGFMQIDGTVAVSTSTGQRATTPTGLSAATATAYPSIHSTTKKPGVMLSPTAGVPELKGSPSADSSSDSGDSTGAGRGTLSDAKGQVEGHFENGGLFHGVRWDWQQSKWAAQTGGTNGKPLVLGFFDTKPIAVEALKEYGAACLKQVQLRLQQQQQGLVAMPTAMMVGQPRPQPVRRLQAQHAST